MRLLCITALAAALLVSSTACASSHEPKKPVRVVAAAPPPPPPPPPAPPAPAKSGAKPVAVTEIVEIISLTHPDLLLSLEGMGGRATKSAKAPARDPMRAEKFQTALDGPAVLAELTTKLAADDSTSIASVRTWLTSDEGKAFSAARKHAIEVRKSRTNLSGPGMERRNACRRLVMALGDGRFHGLTDFSVLTQAFLGMGAPGKVTGDFHKKIIEQGPWVLDRAAEIGLSTEPWTLANIESVIGFWESPAGKGYVEAIDRHLTSTIDARIAQAEGTTVTPAPPAPPAP